MNIINMIDHTLLKNTASMNDILLHVEQAVEMGAFSVCVNPSWVKYASELLENDEVKVCTVIGFPLGATPGVVKAFEAQKAIEDGADEIDMVINIGFAKSQMWEQVLDEIKLVKAAAGDTLVKVIIETSEFDKVQIALLSEIVGMSGVEYIKTSTGTTAKGATGEDILLLREVGEGRYKIKASGGVSDLATALEMIGAGADRIGTSGGLRIKQELAGVNVSGQEVSNY